MTAPNLEKLSFRREIDLFSRYLDAIDTILVATVYAVQRLAQTADEALEKFEASYCEVTSTEKERAVRVPGNHFKEWERRHRRVVQARLAQTLAQRNLLINLVSQFDAYVGRLLRLILLKKPELLASSERKLSFAELEQFSSIESVREYLIEKEVESVLRRSHSEQFTWMSSRFDVTLTKDLDRWPDFIELTERRNLFVHTDGKISSQYLSACHSAGCKTDPSITEGGSLGVPKDYIKSCYRCVYEIGVKLGHVLWRKLFPQEREDADDALVAITYQLVDMGKYSLSIPILDFGCDVIKKHSSEERQLILTVNRAQAYKWNGNQAQCSAIMKAIDWSAKSDQFRLADAVLRDEWPEAAQLMRRIGNDGSVKAHNYRDWPLFRCFRKEAIFLTTYAQVFGEPFSELSDIRPESD